MLRQAWISRATAHLRSPSGYVALVLLLGAGLWWSLGGRRDRVQEDGAVARLPIAASKGPVIEEAPSLLTHSRQLPTRMTDRPVGTNPRPIHADFETATPVEDRAVQAAGLSAHVTANAPVWLTGTIEVE